MVVEREEDLVGPLVLVLVHVAAHVHSRGHLRVDVAAREQHERGRVRHDVAVAGVAAAVQDVPAHADRRLSHERLGVAALALRRRARLAALQLGGVAAVLCRAAVHELLEDDAQQAVLVAFAHALARCGPVLARRVASAAAVGRARQLGSHVLVDLLWARRLRAGHAEDNVRVHEAALLKLDQVVEPDGLGAKDGAVAQAPQHVLQLDVEDARAKVGAVRRVLPRQQRSGYGGVVRVHREGDKVRRLAGALHDSAAISDSRAHVAPAAAHRRGHECARASREPARARRRAILQVDASSRRFVA